MLSHLFQIGARKFI